jgi:hypothetical protein
MIPVLEIDPVLVVGILPMRVVGIDPDLVVGMSPDFVVGMLPDLARAVAETAKTNRIVQNIDINFFIFLLLVT